MIAYASVMLPRTANYPFGAYPFGQDEPQKARVYAEACPPEQYMLVPGVKADCDYDPQGNPICTIYDAEGREIGGADMSCVSDCPFGYKRIIRYSGAYEAGRVHACVKSAVLKEIERVQPDTVERLGPSKVEWAMYGGAAVVGIGIVYAVASAIGGRAA